MQHDAPAGAFVLRPSGSSRAPRWIVGPPRDPEGDGIVLTAVHELHDDGLTAAVQAHVDGFLPDRRVLRLHAFVSELAAEWQGWEGVRRWRSLDDELFLDAQHDGRGHVALGVTLRSYGPTVDDTRWTARAVFHLEAGEELTGVAADLATALGLPD